MSRIGVQAHSASGITFGWACLLAGVFIAVFGLRFGATASTVTLALIVVAQLLTYLLFASWSQRSTFAISTVEALLQNCPPLATADPPPAFFLTYARADMAQDDGVAIENFFHDLECKVKEIQQFQRESQLRLTGTWDRRIRDGFLWHVALLQALNTVKVLVVLGSPSAYKSEHCLSEMEFIVERAKRTAAGCWGIIKVCWIPARTEPELLQKIQDPRRAKYTRYDLDGLSKLAKPDNREAQVEYLQVVHDIAHAIVSAPHLISLSSEEIPWTLGPLAVKANLRTPAGATSAGEQDARSGTRHTGWHFRAIVFTLLLLSLRTAAIYVGESLTSVALEVQSQAKFERYHDQARICCLVDWILIAARAPIEDIGNLEEVQAELQRY